MTGSSSQARSSVLFVCLGNICRSPTAQAVLESLLARSPLAGNVFVDSAGTAAYHLGKTPDPRSQAAASERGYDLSQQRARQVSVEDFHRFDYILAMDRNNMGELKKLTPESPRASLALFSDFLPDHGTPDVPDPYFGDVSGFETVLDMCEQASTGLIAQLQSGRP